MKYTETDFHERSVFYFDVEPQPKQIRTDYDSDAWTWVDGNNQNFIAHTNEYLMKNLKAYLMIFSPFNVGDKLYFAKSWYWRGMIITDDSQQPASTMPIELAEHFKTVTNVGVEYCYVEGGEFADCIEIEPDKKWQWKVEVE